MGSTEGLVPITRQFLSSYYDKYPFVPPLSEDVARLSAEIRPLIAHLQSESPLTEDERDVVQEVDIQPPLMIDENMWKNREHMEEILFLLERSHWPALLQRGCTPEVAELATLLEPLKDKFEKTLTMLEYFQSKNSDDVFDTVMTYMPQGFRGTLIRQQRERSERNKQAEVDALVESGGSIRDKYALLWRQQMERRTQLAQLGSATGVFKTLVKYLVGVPQVLLDFIQQINDDEGNKHQLDILEQAVQIYTSEFESEVFANSPFFLSADEVGAAESRGNEDYKEISIAAGRTHEVVLAVESTNSYIAWDFSLDHGKLKLDIGFSIEYTNSAGEKILILPYRRCDSDQGNFCTIAAGSYKLIWDNSYSTFFSKALRYKVDCIPPVIEPAEQ